MDAFALGDDKFEFACSGDADAEHRDRAFFDFEFHAGALAGFAVVFHKAAEDGFGGGDVNVVRAVVADEHEAFAEIDRVELGETAADAEAVHDEHGDAGFEVGLAAHRETCGGEEGVADDEICDEFAEGAAGLALVVVGEAVELVERDEFVEGDGGARGDVEVFVGEFAREWVGLRVGGVEEAEDLGALRGDFCGRDVAADAEQIVGLGLDDVEAEGGGERGLIGLHVEHVLDGVAEVAEAGAFQIVERHRDLAPLGEFGVGGGVVVEGAEDDFGRAFAHADGDAGELGDGAEIVVGELHVRRGLGVVERGERLEGDEDDGHIESADDCAKGGRGRVGDHVAEDEVEVGGFEFREERVGVLGLVDHTEVGDGRAGGGDAGLEDGELREEFVEEAGKLAPVNVVADAEEADARGARFAARDADDGGGGGSGGSGHGRISGAGSGRGG